MLNVLWGEQVNSCLSPTASIRISIVTYVLVVKIIEKVILREEVPSSMQKPNI